jgi:mevalonate kinase
MASIDAGARSSDIDSAAMAMGRGQGKVILLGEHAVVHGVPALAAGLAIGATATAERASGDRLDIAPWGVSLGAGDDLPLARALSAAIEARGAHAHAHVKAEVSVPGGAGLGSSAALGVAVIRALDALDGVTRTDDDTQRVALAWERVFHGNPSGIDTAMAIAGGVALYRRNPGEGQKTLERVVPRTPITLVIAHSGEGASTRAMVESVARQKERDPARFEKALAAIDALVSNARLALEQGDLRSLGQLFDMNQSLLAAWMVSTGTIEEMCDAARKAGALGAKLTGGGGGGCMIALAKSAEAAEPIRAALLEHGKKEAWIVTAGTPRDLAAENA